MDLKIRRLLIYLLPFIGDLTNMILSVLFIIYADSVGFSTTKIGWIVSAYGLSYLIMPFLIGKLVDRLSHRKSLIIATTGQMVNAIVYIFMMDLPINILYFVIIGGQVTRAAAYSFYWPSIESFLSESTSKSSEAHEKSIRWFCISWGFGAAIGSPIGGFFSDLRIVNGYIIVLLAYFAALLIVIVAIPKNRGFQLFPTTNFSSEGILRFDDGKIAPLAQNVPKNGQNDVSKPEVLSGHTISPSDPSSEKINLNSLAILLLLGTLLYAICSKGFLGYFPNYAVISGGLNLSGFVTGQVLFIFGIGQFIAFISGKFLKNSFFALKSSILIISILFLTMALVKNVIILSIIMFIAGFFIARVYYLSLELTMKYEPSSKGAKAGLFESMVGLGLGITPIIAGFIAEFNLTIPFYTFSSLCMIFFIGFSIYLYKNKIK
ncbi:MFS transporter [Candidatus Lokiarchaeum ossiferum]|uniref:MFS transporter n=1 Tax=Candidatus Lokiarchaeum ossiferum TaxID=2951803 RepID=UPI00352C7FB4